MNQNQVKHIPIAIACDVETMPFADKPYQIQYGGEGYSQEELNLIFDVLEMLANKFSDVEDFGILERTFQLPIYGSDQVNGVKISIKYNKYE